MFTPPVFPVRTVILLWRFPGFQYPEETVSGCARHNAYMLPAVGLCLEGYDAVYERKKGMVPSHADVFAGTDSRPALTDDDVSGADDLASVTFNSEAAADTITAVL
jgi:hypothetical protein